MIVAGGAYLSPAILLRSGIGPADDLRALGIDVLADLPGVGANLLDHPCVALEFEGSDGVPGRAGADTAYHPDEQTVGRARSSRCDAGPYDIHVFLVAGANTGHPGLPPISMYGGAMRARSQGRVTLRDADPQLAPLIDHRYLSDPDGHDLQVLTEARDLLERMAAEPTVRRAGGRARHARRVRHPRPGRQLLPPGGDLQRRDPVVAAATAQVHGIEGLYVADASVMPTITRGNPNLPVAAIAAKIAAGLVGVDVAALAGTVA